MSISQASISAATVTHEKLTAYLPCAKCGASDRYANGKCKSCRSITNATYAAKNKEKKKAQAAAWYAENSERVKALHAKWKADNIEKIKELHKRKSKCEAWKARRASLLAARRKENPEKERERSRAWAEKNREKKNAGRKAWAAANPEARRISRQNRRARKKQAGGKLSAGLASKLFNLQQGKCPCCKKPLGENYHLDHIQPLALGGTNTDDNIQLLRAQCNNQKHAKHPIDFMQQRGFLL